jgi:hypothetical protein
VFIGSAGRLLCCPILSGILTRYIFILLKVASMKFNEKLLSGSGVITRGSADRQTGFSKQTDPIFTALSCPSTSRKTSQIV